ncbi:hypothetical protein [Plantibacter sp. YIM 135347]|uniref:hypothetical protein n=1 Tax=Plantibacter sp. YIM 135347 TaxID=3423919 RepID=UPI003D3554FE
MPSESGASCVDARARTNRHLIPPAHERSDFRIGGSLGARNEEALHRAFTEPDLDPRLKLAIVLIAVYGIRTHRLVGLHLCDLSAVDRPRVRLGREWLDLPLITADWISLIHTTPGRTRHGELRTSTWVFPGYRHGCSLNPSSLAATLRQLGLSPSRAHQASTANIISQIPPIVAARLLGVAPSTAADWYSLIANTAAAFR